MTPDSDAEALRTSGDLPPLEGGTSGVPEGEATLMNMEDRKLVSVDPNANRQASMEHARAQHTARMQTGIPNGLAARDAVPSPVARRFRVVGGPANVSIPGSGLCKFYVNKEVSESTYNIDNLLKQGVVLQEIEQPTAAVADPS